MKTRKVSESNYPGLIVTEAEKTLLMIDFL